ncbi:hypothetical protein YS40_129 [Thermus phage phiYS40]|uniref:hypothetical protein n=1 Tax=Thermus phage phiYS40 TaxID=407392 RepID=UPI0000E689F7|nr:hypothetical protein YS40_129 [Thermus phage phiYS40]ABJ91523.1 hypothetical protein YS40_129 [Thermus phage phiYS40]BAK53647.1 hypothetical protein YSP_129 [Thermus phage phiYS40]
MKLKLSEIALFYLQESFAASKGLLKAAENKYKFTFNKDHEEKELEEKAIQLMLKFIKQTIEIEKLLEVYEDEDFYLAVNHNMRKEDLDTKEKPLGYDIKPEEVLKTILKERNELLTKLLKLKNIDKKDQIIISIIFTKGSPYKDDHVASLEVVYYYDIVHLPDFSNSVPS